jgi:peptide chain release factor subunit 1
MGQLEDVTGVAGEDVKRHKQGGWAAARYQRHEDEAAYRNLKDAAEMTAEFVRDGRCQHLILGGTDENVSHFAAHLPKHVRALVVGAINVDMTASPAEVGEKSLALIRKAGATRKQALIEQLLTTAAKGGPAALGLKDTLTALYAGRAHHLVLDENYTASAFRCDNCGYVEVQPLPACPSCGSALRVLPDAADSLVRWSIDQGIDLTIVSNAEQLVEQGAVGALLRY